MHKLLSSIILLGAFFVTAAFGADATTKAATVGFIPKLDTDPYFGVAKSGAEEAQKEIGGKVIQEAPSSATGDAQIEFINNLVSQKVDVIAIAGNDPNAVAPALKRAQTQGVRVVSYDSDVAKNARGIFINQVNFDSIAQQMLESMGNLIGYDGEFAILSSTATATNQNAWIDSMKKALASDPKFAKMKLVQVAYGEESEQVNQQQALALVQAFPNLKGIIIPAGIGLPAAARALEQAGLLKKDQIDRTRAREPDEKVHSGWQCARYLVECPRPGLSDLLRRPGLRQGKITGKKGETFAAGRLGNLRSARMAKSFSARQ